MIVENGVVNYNSTIYYPVLKYITNDNIIPLISKNTYKTSGSGYYLIDARLGVNNDYNSEDVHLNSIVGITMLITQNLKTIN